MAWLRSKVRHNGPLANEHRPGASTKMSGVAQVEPRYVAATSKGGGSTNSSPIIVDTSNCVVRTASQIVNATAAPRSPTTRHTM